MPRRPSCSETLNKKPETRNPSALPAFRSLRVVRGPVVKTHQIPRTLNPLGAAENLKPETPNPYT